MRQILIYIALSLVLLAGCRQTGTDSPRLVELDSLIAVAPDSAVALLQAMPADSLPTANDRAYHALLLTQAKYKAYIPIHSLDTINHAVSHYTDGHDPDKHTRSVLYKGCVFEDMQVLDSAMYYYKLAEDIAAQAGDNYHRGYALMRMAWIYQTQQTASSNRLAAVKYQQALQNFIILGDSAKQLECMMELSSLLYPFDADSALSVAKHSEELSVLLGDSATLYTTKSVKAQIMLDMMRYEDAKNLALDVLAHTDNSIDVCNSLMTASQAYCKMGVVDSAEFYFSIAPQPLSHKDSIIYFRTLAELQQARHDLEGYITNSELVINSTGIMEDSSAKNALAMYEIKVEEYLAACRHQTQRARMTRLLLWLVAFIILSVCSAWFVHRKRKKAENMANKLTKDLDVLNGRLSQMTSKHVRTVKEKTELEERFVEELTMNNMLESKLQLMAETNEGLRQTLDNLKKQTRLLGEHPTLKLTEGWVVLLVELVNKFNSKKQKDTVMKENFNREILTDELLECLIQYIDAKYDGLTTKVTEHCELTRRDINIMCMHFCGFSNAAIKAYMGTTDDHYVTTVKRAIAKKVLHNSVKINDILKRFSS